jgi:hypothetical protein
VRTRWNLLKAPGVTATAGGPGFRKQQGGQSTTCPSAPPNDLTACREYLVQPTSLFLLEHSHISHRDLAVQLFGGIMFRAWRSSEFVSNHEESRKRARLQVHSLDQRDAKCPTEVQALQNSRIPSKRVLLNASTITRVDLDVWSASKSAWV